MGQRYERASPEEGWHSVAMSMYWTVPVSERACCKENSYNQKDRQSQVMARTCWYHKQECKGGAGSHLWKVLEASSFNWDVITSHKIHSFKVDHTVVFSVFTDLCNLHHCLIPEHYRHLSRKSLAHQLSPPTQQSPNRKPMQETQFAGTGLGQTFCLV